MNKFFPVLKILTKKQKKNFALLILLMTIALGLEVAGIGMFIPLMYALIDNVDKIRDNFLFEIIFEKNESVEKIFLISATALCGFLILKNLYMIIFHYFEGKFIHDARETTSARLFKKFINNDYSFFVDKHTSKMLTRIKSDLDLLTGALTSLSIIFTEIVMATGISVVIFLYSPSTFLIVASILIFFHYYIFY